MKKIHWLVLGFYGALSFLVLNVIALHPTTYVPGPESDFYHFHWNFWWVRHAIFDLKQSIYVTDYLHVPFEQNLAFHTLTLVWFPFYLLFEPLMGQILVVNVMIWLSLTLSGFLTYIFLRTEQLIKETALLGGVILLASPYLIFHIWDFHLNLLALFWLPATALLWRKTVQTQSWRWALTLGIAFWGVWLTDTQWLVWLPFFLSPYGIMTLLGVSTYQNRLRLCLLGFLSIGVMLTLAWFIAPWQQMTDFQGVVQPADLEAAAYWSVPFSALWGKSGIHDQSLGHILIPLVIVAIFVRSPYRKRWLWFTTGLISLLLAFGPTITLFNNEMTMPYRWLHELFGGMYRAPARFLPIILLTFSLFVGLSIQPHLTQLRLHWRLLCIGVVTIGLVGDGRIFRPIPAYEIPHYQVYHDMRIDRSDTVIVEVPLGVANGWNAVGKFWPIEQYQGIYHEKRMVNGFVAREPSNNYLYYELSPLWNWLAGNINLDFDAAKTEIVPLITDWPVGYVVVHQDYFGADDPRTLQWLQFFNSLDEFCLFATEADMVVYRSTTHPNGCTNTLISSVNLGIDDIDKMGLGWYWSENFGGLASRWMQKEASLYIFPPETTDTLTITAATAFETPRNVEIWINNEYIDAIEVVEGWQTYTLDIVNDIIEPNSRIELRLVSDVVDTVGERQLAIAVSSITFK
jgi:hypothetical protein